MIRNVKPGWERSTDHKMQTARRKRLKTLHPFCGGRRQGNRLPYVLSHTPPER